jgi:hypothetical protein
MDKCENGVKHLFSYIWAVDSGCILNGDSVCFNRISWEAVGTREGTVKKGKFLSRFHKRLKDPITGHRGGVRDKLFSFCCCPGESYLVLW